MQKTVSKSSPGLIGACTCDFRSPLRTAGVLLVFSSHISEVLDFRCHIVPRNLRRSRLTVGGSRHHPPRHPAGHPPWDLPPVSHIYLYLHSFPHIYRCLPSFSYISIFESETPTCTRNWLQLLRIIAAWRAQGGRAGEGGGQNRPPPGAPSPPFLW